ncbi:MAG TPA: DUF6404 family protein [Candidatus Binataceae bacterium]|nr:DUF6404 family protein [Candidatus Binataceae bacterium]
MQRQTKIGLGIASLGILVLLRFQIDLVWNGTFDRHLDRAVQYVRITPLHFATLPSGSYLRSLVLPIGLMVWGLIEFFRSRTGTLRTAGFLLAFTASLTFFLRLAVWLLGPNEPTSVMAPSLASTHLILITQAFYFTCMDLESISIVFLALSYSETPARSRYATMYRCASPDLIHREKVERIVRELEAKGIDRSTTAPGIFRLLWTLGAAIPPPLFLGFLPAMLIFGVSFASVLALVFWLMGPASELWLSAIGGVLFGLVTAAYFGWKSKTLRLPAWKDYGLD